jgi:hypothetical protein
LFVTSAKTVTIGLSDLFRWVCEFVPTHAILAIVDTKVLVILAHDRAFLHREVFICHFLDSVQNMGCGVGEATLVMVGVLVGSDSVKQILFALEVLLLVVCEIFDLGHQKVFIGLARGVILETRAAASISGRGERIERLIKLDAIGTSTRAGVMVCRWINACNRRLHTWKIMLVVLSETITRSDYRCRICMSSRKGRASRGAVAHCSHALACTGRKQK